jgi:uncharacterized protein with HEPN domain
MSENRLPDYLDHIQQAATDARSCGRDGQGRLLADKRTQQAVIMSLIVIGEAAKKVMDGYVEFTQAHADVPWRSMRNMRNRMAHGYFDQPRWCGGRYRMAAGVAPAIARRASGCRR